MGPPARSKRFIRQYERLPRRCRRRGYAPIATLVVLSNRSHDGEQHGALGATTVDERVRIAPRHRDNPPDHPYGAGRPSAVRPPAEARVVPYGFLPASRFSAVESWCLEDGVRRTPSARGATSVARGLRRSTTGVVVPSTVHPLCPPLVKPATPPRNGSHYEQQPASFGQGEGWEP